MVSGLLLLLLFFTTITATLFSLSSSTSTLQSDINSLLAFKASADPSGNLATWTLSGSPSTTTPTPCSTWYGITCSSGRVTRVVLEGLFLTGTDLSSLSNLTELRVLSLKSNSFSGDLPDLSKLTALKLLFLSHNSFSGVLPKWVSSLWRLYRLDLSHNNLSGEIPPELGSLKYLLTLRLNNNNFSGFLPGNLYFKDIQDLNFSSNSLTGAVPRSLSSFPASVFSANPGLCGSPLSSCPEAVGDPTRPKPGSPSAAAAPPPVPPASAVISSSPGSIPQVSASSSEHPQRPKISRAAVAAIVAGDFAALILVCGLLLCYFWRKFAGKSSIQLQEGEKIVYSSSPYAAAAAVAGGGVGFELGRMVFLEGTKRFELEDLLRASAEMLGKGGHGTAYKAVLDDGCIVAVKRLREVHMSGGKREFEHHMDVLGRLRHANLVPLIAYYYARDEKLLVYDFMPNGNLFSLLHGNRGPGRTPLDWATRMRIACGSARGLTYIHSFQLNGKSAKLVHGNIKSTNILLDKSGNARLADAGLALLGPSGIAMRVTGYRAPEITTAATQKSDVYAFGIVLLELLTGRAAAEFELVRWVASVVREEWTAEVFDLELMRYKGIEEELVQTLQLAMSCTAQRPEQRPKMAHVLRALEEIRGGVSGELSPSHESFDSVSDSPSVSEDNTGHYY